MQKGNEPLYEHLPLEEVRIDAIDSLDPPEEWDPESPAVEPVPPPVLIEENSRFSLLVHHDSFWRARCSGMLAVRAVVVRSSVHIPIAHKTVKNSLEEALLFDGLLRAEIVPNRSRLAEMLGYSRARITQVLNVLKLPLQIRQGLLLSDSISEFHLRPLIKIDDERRQVSAFKKLMADGLTGRQMALFAAAEEAGASRGGSESPLSDIERLMSEPGGAEIEKGAGVQEFDPVAVKGIEPEKPGGQVPVRDSAVRAPEIEMAQLEKPSTVTASDRVRASRPAPKAEPGRPESVSTPERDLFVRARGLLEIMGALRETDWEDRATRNGVTREEMVFLEGVSLLRKGLYEKAAETLMIASHLSRGNSAIFFFLGRSYNLMEKLASAEEYLRAACENVPDDPDILSELAIVLEKQKRYSEASSFYKRAAAIRNPVPPRGRKP